MIRYYSLVFAVISFSILSAQPSTINHGDIASIEEGDYWFENDTPIILGDNGFKFESVTTGINTPYSDYGVGFFRGKFITFSARKIGAFPKKDARTKEPFTKLFCSDVINDWDLDRPLLFSYVLNKNENLGSLTFTKDERTLYFTKSEKGASHIFQLYKAEMHQTNLGKWANISPVSFSSSEFSIENPHLSADGRTLYFSSNMPGTVGGFDIFQVDINEDGSFSDVSPVQGLVNTVHDEKFPHLSLDGKFLFFSSKGHENAGGFDVFKTRRTKKGYVTIVNLGNTINSKEDEIAFIPATEKIGYITSNREGGKGRYDIYKITEYVKPQQVSGLALDFQTRTPVSNAWIRLIDTDGVEVATAKTDTDGVYNFPVSSFEHYTVVSEKDGFYSGSSIFTSDNVTPNYNIDVTLKLRPAEIVMTEEKRIIKIDNIQFDYNSDVIKSISEITLNKVYQTLVENPEIKVELNAHSDSQGSDSYNLLLSKKRASAAAFYLISKGISKNRIRSQGYGESQPLIACDLCTEEQFEANRRIEFIIIEELD